MFFYLFNVLVMPITAVVCSTKEIGHPRLSSDGIKSSLRKNDYKAIVAKVCFSTMIVTEYGLFPVCSSGFNVRQRCNAIQTIGHSLRSTPTNGLSPAILGGPLIQVLTEVDVA